MTENAGYSGYQGYGGYGATLTPQQAQMRLAQSMLEAGSSAEPIRAPSQGYARLAQALMGGLMFNQLRGQQGAGSDALLAQGPGLPGIAGPGTAVPAAGAGGPIGGTASPGVSGSAAPAAGGGAPGGAGVKMADYSPEQRSSLLDAMQEHEGYFPGSRSSRNNNPGNIEAGSFTAAHGATGSDGRFAIFPDYATGRAAQEALLFESAGYKNLTLPAAIGKWAPAGENDVPAYIAAMNANKPSSQAGPVALETGQPPGGGFAVPPPGQQVQPQSQVAGPGAPPQPQTDARTAWRQGQQQQGGAQPQQSGAAGFNNPFQGLLDMFSGKGGTSGAPPPRGQPAASYGAPGGNDQIAALTQQYNSLIIALRDNPGMDPETRQLIAQRIGAIQTLMMPHPQTWMDTPAGGKQAVDQWGRPISGQAMAAPPKFELINKDAAGNEHYGYVYPDGRVVPYGNPGSAVPPPNPGGGPAPTLPGQQPGSVSAPPSPQAQGGAPPPPMAPPAAGAPAPGAQPPLLPQQGPAVNPNDIARSDASPLSAGMALITPRASSYLDQQAKDPYWGQYAAQARALLNGQPVPGGSAQARGNEQQILALAHAADPDYSPQLMVLRMQGVAGFADKTTANSPGGLIMNANAAMSHLSLLWKADQALQKLQPLGGNSGVLNEGQAWTNEKILNQNPPLMAALGRFNMLRGVFTDEYGKFLSGGQGTDAMRMQVEKGLDPNAPPSMRMDAMRGAMDALRGKMDEVQRTWQDLLPPGVQNYPVYGREAQAAIANLSAPLQGSGTGPQAAPPAAQVAPELTREQYDAAPSGTPYRVPGSNKVLKKP
jgi:hypothetical protein